MARACSTKLSCKNTITIFIATAANIAIATAGALTATPPSQSPALPPAPSSPPRTYRHPRTTRTSATGLSKMGLKGLSHNEGVMAFRLFDADGEGTISIDELDTGLRRMMRGGLPRASLR